MTLKAWVDEEDWREDRKQLVFTIVIMTVAFFAMMFMALHYDYRHRIPECPEDSLLVGIGDFEAGRWEAYECGPARDDYRL